MNFRKVSNPTPIARTVFIAKPIQPTKEWEIVWPRSRTNGFFNLQEDLDWLLETHLKSDEDLGWIKLHLRSFILIGNEDFPLMIECYSAKKPYFGNQPFFVKRGD